MDSAPDGNRNAAQQAGQLFKTRDVVELLDLSRRQLQYWAKTRLITPSAHTPGGHHRYTFDDLVALKATKRLIDAGVSVQKIRKSVSALQAILPRVGRPLSELVLVATGDVVLAFGEDTDFEAISGREWVFEVAGFQREVNLYRRSTGRSVNGERNGKTRSHPYPGQASQPPGLDGSQPSKPGPRAARRRDDGLSETG